MRLKVILKSIWHFWEEALGARPTVSNAEITFATVVRTIVVLVSLLANIMLIINVVHHWRR